MRDYLVVAAILAFQLGGARVPLHAAEKPQATAPANYTGGVVDPAGKPAAGCHAYLVNAGPPWKLEVVEEAVSEADGSFVLRTPRPWSPDKSGRTLRVFVRDAQGRIGFPDWSKPNAIAEQGGRFRLVEVGKVYGRLVDTSGRPLADIDVRPCGFAAAEFGKPGVWWTSLPEVVRSKMIAKTGTEGTFVLWGLPMKGTLNTKILGGEYGVLDAYWGPGKPVEIVLDRVGVIRGTVTCPDSTAAEGLKLRLVPADGDPFEGRDYRLIFDPSTVTQKGGQFRIANVIPGRYRLELELGDRKGFFTDSAPIVEVKPGASLDNVSIALRADLQIKGTVVDAESGAGIKGVDMFLLHSSDQNRGWRTQGRARTDDQGRFVAKSKPGKVVAMVAAVPDGYVRPPMRIDSDQPDLTKDITLPAIRLARAIPVEGLVVDGAGKPVAGAEVRATVTQTQGGAPVLISTSEGGTRKTDSQGRFQIKGVPAGAELSIYVRSAAGVTDGALDIDPKKPIRLVVSPKHAFGLRGQVIGKTGKPIRWANVRMMVLWSVGQIRTGHQLETKVTDAKGEFAFDNLWPDGEYQATIEVDGYDPAQTPAVAGAAGEVHDLGRISPVFTGRQNSGPQSGRIAPPVSRPLPARPAPPRD